MLVNVSDAKFLFCPFLMTHDDRMKMCQVTQCMMWRWTDREQGMGYCGLAGKPEGAA